MLVRNVVSPTNVSSPSSQTPPTTTWSLEQVGDEVNLEARRDGRRQTVAIISADNTLHLIPTFVDLGFQRDSGGRILTRNI